MATKKKTTERKTPARKKTSRRRTSDNAATKPTRAGKTATKPTKTATKSATKPAKSAAKPAKTDRPFAQLGLSPELVSTLDAIGFIEPTEIQRELIPVALSGKDCLGQAKTGTGKTAAFALPLLQNTQPGDGLQALVLVPTRELAAQVEDHFKLVGEGRDLKTAVAYGGRRIVTQVKAIRAGAEILIGTPGRVLDLMGRGDIKLGALRFVVLDEVDRMLDIGFRDDIRRILKAIKTKHQTIFVSATFTDEIRKLAKTYMHEPVEINVSADVLTVDSVHHGYVTVPKDQKVQTLLGMLKSANPTLAIIFTNMKVTARKVTEKLKKAGINCAEIHGDLMQRRREKVLENFRKAHVHVLVATDLASRGLDVMEVSHIVNYDVPEDPAVYVHRIGRTARMGKSGYAVTFVQPDEGRPLTEIELLINRQLPRFDEPWAPPAPDPHDVLAEETNGEGVQAEEEEADAAANAPKRYQEPMKRCDVLESWGIQPQPRTLGSRFSSARKRK